MKLIKDYVSLFSGFALQLMAIWLEWLDNVELLRLQKIFYLSSIILIWIGIVQVLFRARAKNRRRKRWMENLTDTQQAKKIVELAKNPSKKGQVIVDTFHLIQKGGRRMKAKLLSLTWKQILSLVAVLVLFVLGVGSAFIPELAPVAEHFNEIALAVGVVAVPGIFSKGKALGTDVQETISKMKRIKELNRLVKEEHKKLVVLDLDYAYLKPYLERIQQYGGSLTDEQNKANQTYITQRAAIEKKIQGYKDELTLLTEVK